MIGRRLGIDFAARRTHNGAAGKALTVGLLAAAAAVLVAVEVEVRDRLQQAAQQRATAAASDRAQRQAAAQRQRTVVTVSAERARAVNDAIRRLNLEWDKLFVALNSAAEGQQSAREGRVALLSLEPDVAGGVVKLIAETRNPESMLAYQKRLAGRPELAGAVITRHEVLVDEPQRPIRFWIEARIGGTGRQP